MDLRAKYKEKFEKIHGVGLGFMSFFARAVVLALQASSRASTRSIDGDDIVYHNYVHLGIAVSTDRGLAVPVLRNVEHDVVRARSRPRSSASPPPRATASSACRNSPAARSRSPTAASSARCSRTPIINPPQSGILGMHAIQKRPVVVDDKIEIRPMMYVALSYDHRLVDGRESVSFLVRVKEYAGRSGAADAGDLTTARLARRPSFREGQAPRYAARRSSELALRGTSSHS